jgi:HPt (histidine-containing phosphotransfer) domain-containing protein
LLASGDFDELSDVAHKMAGSGGLYGFHLLTELGAALDASARAADRVGGEKHLQELREYLARLRLPADRATRES